MVFGEPINVHNCERTDLNPDLLITNLANLLASQAQYLHFTKMCLKMYYASTFYFL